MGNWSELQRDLLSAIARRLEEAADRARFSAVCRNWSSLAKSEINYFPPNPPWLMLTEHERPEPSHRDFVGADGKQRFRVELPEGRGSRCIGSSGCWLVMIDSTCDTYILNPFSRVKIDLPSVRWLRGSVVPDDEEDKLAIRDYFFQKVILFFPKSQSPIDDDFIAVLIYANSSLAFTKKGAESWQTIESIDNRFYDVIFFQDKFYAVDISGKVSEFNIHCSHDEKPDTIPISDPLLNVHYNVRHLVGFGDQLLQVLNLDNYMEVKDCLETRPFLVFKLDFTCGGWVELSDLGQHSIFVGLNSGVALLASSNYTFKPNCVYFSPNELIKMWDDAEMYYYCTPLVPVWIIPASLSQNQ